MGEPGVRVAAVTGGARGIGLAIARRLLNNGLAILVIDINERALASLDLLEEARAGRLDYELCSVTDRPAVAAAFARAAERWGGLDVLVNNAGINKPGDLLSQPSEDWEQVLATNLTGAFVCSAEAVRLMLPRGQGAIVTIGSVAGAGFAGSSPAYAASKAGLVGLTKSMAASLGRHGIRANLVAPGTTLTEWVMRHVPESRRDESMREVPLQRLGEPEDVAAAVAFLASPDARHITGQVISVSGGQWMP